MEVLPINIFLTKQIQFLLHLCQLDITRKLFHVFVTGKVKDPSALHSALLFILKCGKLILTDINLSFTCWSVPDTCLRIHNPAFKGHQQLTLLRA